MTWALLVLLGAAAIYLGSVGAAFESLMRLSLRLLAERSGRSSRLGAYLDDPPLLFLPVRLLLGVVDVAATLCIVAIVGLGNPRDLAVVPAAALGFVLVCQHLLPALLVKRGPERVLEALLPSFDLLARGARAVTGKAGRLFAGRPDTPPASASSATDDEQNEATAAYLDAGEQEGIIERDERQLLQSIVDFSDTLVREVMTPRPDIVAIRADATLAELRAFFREQEYSRIPVYADSLDNIVGFVFIKDLMRLPADQAGDTAVATLVRPAHVVPETKRVSELLREFQRLQVQIAIVVDEYGGTAGIVTAEDLLEEIVGEIRDEYDVETEPVVEEPNGRFLVTGKADIDTVAERLGVEIEREGFETFGGYIMARLGRVPAVAETFEVDDLSVEVIDAERRRVHRLRVRRRNSTSPAGSADGAGGAGGEEGAGS